MLANVHICEQNECLTHLVQIFIQRCQHQCLKYAPVMHHLHHLIACGSKHSQVFGSIKVLCASRLNPRS